MFVFAHAGEESGIPSHSSDQLSPAHPQTSRNTEGTGRVDTGRAKGAIVLGHTSTGGTSPADSEFLID